MELKPFRIDIKGIFCGVPHPDRVIEVLSVLDYPYLELTNTEMLVVVHEVSCNLKRKLQNIMKDKEMDELTKKFGRYHNEKENINAKTKEINIEISGKYSDIPNSGRQLTVDYRDNNLTEGETSVILYDIVCVMRNHLLKTMNRDEIAEFAEKHKIYNFGMRKSEEPFVTRGEEKT